jgi:hypothetical protein
MTIADSIEIIWEFAKASVGPVTQFFIAAGVIANVVQSFLNARKIETVHKATNSMKDELVAAVREEAFQAGQIQQAGPSPVRPRTTTD